MAINGELYWKDALWKAADKVMKDGGEIKFIVICRDRERIPEIYVYPANKVRCKTEVMVD